MLLSLTPQLLLQLPHVTHLRSVPLNMHRTGNLTAVLTSRAPLWAILPCYWMGGRPLFRHEMELAIVKCEALNATSSSEPQHSPLSRTRAAGARLPRAALPAQICRLLTGLSGRGARHHSPPYPTGLESRGVTAEGKCRHAAACCFII